MFIAESSHHPISRKESGQLCMYHLHVSPALSAFLVIVIEFPIESESPLVKTFVHLKCLPETIQSCGVTGVLVK